MTQVTLEGVSFEAMDGSKTMGGLIGGSRTLKPFCLPIAATHQAAEHLRDPEDSNAPSLS